MEIPAIYSVFKGGEARAASAKIDGTKISLASEPEMIEYSADKTAERMPVVIVDVKGLGRGRPDDRLLSNVRFPGSDTWFLTFIYDVNDVFDCLMGEVDSIIIPYHTINNNHVMKDAYDVSENCIPAVFVSMGMAVCRDGLPSDLRLTVRELAEVGFGKIIVFDTDSSLFSGDWADLHDIFQGLIPFIRKDSGQIENTMFREIIIDL
jgi:hypothetical protein